MNTLKDCLKELSFIYLLVWNVTFGLCLYEDLTSPITKADLGTKFCEVMTEFVFILLV